MTSESPPGRVILTPKQILRLWVAYEKQSVLWDFDHVKYSNQAARLAAYKAMVKELKIPGINVRTVKKKIRTLRNRYSAKMLTLCQLKALNKPFPPLPNWFHVADSFLRDQTRLKNPNTLTESLYLPPKSKDAPFKIPRTGGADYYSDGPASADDVDDDMDDTGKDNEDDNEESIYLELDDAQLMAIENGEMSIEEVAAKAEQAAKLQRRGGKPANDEHADGSDDENSNEFDAFGRCVALQLKTLPLDAALELETQIHSLITKQRLAYLRQTGGC
ncbi:Alcohol dehydrogenase transcription factor Myb/SANT-like [Nesidiocoris tenuis]|uniref:Alcohol dehydrogenase transcription factor Myb/SANT-like n=1 Tax=Nesidiocoris tenuis TaxID=355587 RepID=A0ABN7AYB7_9HEMI|nr:Alcohol dehydrogenase transcription factor Myb/SANT-like [Nesidiocoris tenuis]